MLTVISSSGARHVQAAVLERATTCAQAEERWCPYLLMFGEHVGPPSAVAAGRPAEDGDAQQALAAALPQLRALEAFVDGAEALILNLAAQLGSLSAAQMRKPTILHGAPDLCSDAAPLPGSSPSPGSDAADRNQDPIGSAKVTLQHVRVPLHMLVVR